MRIRWLGWAGVEIEAEGERVVVDPLEDANAVFAWLGERAPEMLAAAGRRAVAGRAGGLVTHLHRDHADAAALAAALPTVRPCTSPSTTAAPASSSSRSPRPIDELDAAGLARRETEFWASASVGPFTLTALPAVDGTGDPQVSWLIEAGGKRVLHLGDTIFHGWWWRIAERFGAPDVVLAPINGARLTFPHRQPPSPLAGALDPEQAALAAELLQAERLVPMHYGGYAIDRYLRAGGRSARAPALGERARGGGRGRRRGRGVTR